MGRAGPRPTALHLLGLSCDARIEAWDINGQLGPLHELMEIADIHRADTPDHQPDPAWHIEGHDFDLRSRAVGYAQYLRMPPRHFDRQVLTEAERSGIRFAEHSFA